MTQHSREHESQLKNIDYPAILEIRVISSSDFNCEDFLLQNNIKPFEKSIALSKNGRFKTYKFTFKYSSYEDYIEVRTLLSKQSQIHIIL